MFYGKTFYFIWQSSVEKKACIMNDYSGLYGQQVPWYNGTINMLSTILLVSGKELALNSQS